VSLTAADVAEIMRLVEQSNFDELILEMDGIKLCLRRGALEHPLPAPVTEAVTAAATATNTFAAPVDPNIHEVASPLLGTFYRAPKPGAAPFVEVGTQVEEETVVAIIEVMKLMNTVRAGTRGTVTEILLADGALAEYGQALLRVRKTG
jgi:acetyl-CoA carboxylase biotin carboxyl carrier protein